MLVFSDNEILTALNHSKWNFYLTGSRFFGDALPSSDFDFFVQAPSHPNEQEEQRIFLYKLGFRVDEDGWGRYADGKTVGVYQCVDAAGKSYDIQIVNDAALKCKMQQMIKSSGQFMNIYSKVNDKTQRKDFWDLLYRVVELGAENT